MADSDLLNGPNRAGIKLSYALGSPGRSQKAFEGFAKGFGRFLGGVWPPPGSWPSFGPPWEPPMAGNKQETAIWQSVICYFARNTFAIWALEDLGSLLL